VNGAALSNAMMGAWYLLIGDKRAQDCFDLSPEGAMGSFTGLLLALPILFFSSTAALRLATSSEHFPIEIPFGPFITAEMLGTVVYWAVFLFAMARIARALGLAQAYTPYLITFNWGMLFTNVVFALPLVPYSLGLYSDGVALFLMLPALIVLFVYHWRIAREVLGAEQGPAIAIVIFAALLSFSIDQIVGFLILPAGGLGG
jgi:hypothetical protein